MPDIEMPPQYAGGDYPDPQDTERHVFRAIQGECADRLQNWGTMVLTAIDQFETNANYHIAKLEYESTVDVPFGPVLRSFASVVVDQFPPTATIKGIVSTVMDGLESDYESQLEAGLKGAKLQLLGAVRAFVIAARQRTTQTIEDVHPRIAELVDEAMTWVDSASTDPTYVSTFCDWMGFPLPTAENTGNPVRQALENPFFGSYQNVRAQLLRIQGVPGLDDDDLSPTRWQREAVEHQQQAYRRDGPAAWDQVYNEVN